MNIWADMKTENDPRLLQINYLPVGKTNTSKWWQKITPVDF